MRRLLTPALLLSSLLACGDGEDPAAADLAPGEPAVAPAGDAAGAGAGDALGELLDQVEERVEDAVEGAEENVRAELELRVQELRGQIAQKQEELAGVLGALEGFAPQDLLSKKGLDLKDASAALKDEIGRLQGELAATLEELKGAGG